MTPSAGPHPVRRRARRRALLPVPLVAALLAASASAAVAAPTVALSPDDVGRTAGVYRSATAVNDRGDAVALMENWRRTARGRESVVQARRFDAASASWRPVATLGAPTRHLFGQWPEAAIDAQGNAFALWSATTSVVADDDGKGNVQQSARLRVRRLDAATGDWSPPRALSPAGDPAQAAQIAVDGHGNAIVVWVQYSDTDDYYNGENHIAASRYDADTGSWQQVPIALSRSRENQERWYGYPRVAVDSAGNAVAVWVEQEGNRRAVQASRFDAASGQWQAQPTTLSDAANVASPDVEFDAAGHAIAVWARADAGSAATVVQARRMDPAGRWEAAATTLTPATRADRYLDLTVDGAGDAAVIWNGGRRGERTSVKLLRYDAATARWDAAPTVLTRDGTHAVPPRLASDAAGDLTAIWKQVSADGGRRLQLNRFDAATGRWARPVELGRGHLDLPDVDLGAGGAGFATWIRKPPGRGHVFFARALP